MFYLTSLHRKKYLLLFVFYKAFFAATLFAYANDYTQGTPLHKALFTRNREATKQLVTSKEYINAPTEKGMTPLHYAACYEDCGIVDLLLSHGARLQSKDSFGRTALHYAAFSGNTKTVKLLLNRGASPLIPDKEGLLPADCARSDPDLAAFLSQLTEKAGIQPVIQKKSSIHPSCRRLGIFINNDTATEYDSIVIQCENFLRQKAAPCLLSAALLEVYCGERKKSCPRGQRACNTFFSLTQKLRKNELLSNWILYKHDQAYLLLPRYSSQEPQLYEYGFNSKAGFERCDDYKGYANGVLHDGGASFVKSLELLFSGEQDKKAPWSIYLAGHGSPGERCAGLSYSSFKRLLTFFSETKKLFFLFYDTCYGGDRAIIDLFCDKNKRPLTYNFTIAQGSTTGLPTIALRESRFYPVSNYVIFFGTLDILHASKKKLTIDTCKQLCASLRNYAVHDPVSHTPLIRFAGADSFIACPLSQQVQLLTKESLDQVFEKNIKSSLVFSQEAEVILLYAPTITQPLTISSSVKKIVSMDIDHHIHNFDTLLERKPLSIDLFFRRFFLDVDFSGEKLFQIKNWNNEASEVMIILQGKNKQSSCFCYFKADKPCKIQDFVCTPGCYYCYIIVQTIVPQDLQKQTETPIRQDFLAQIGHRNCKEELFLQELSPDYFRTCLKIKHN